MNELLYQLTPSTGNEFIVQVWRNYIPTDGKLKLEINEQGQITVTVIGDLEVKVVKNNS
jgi:hypothetical protein